MNKNTPMQIPTEEEKVFRVAKGVTYVMNYSALTEFAITTALQEIMGDQHIPIAIYSNSTVTIYKLKLRQE